MVETHNVIEEIPKIIQYFRAMESSNIQEKIQSIRVDAEKSLRLAATQKDLYEAKVKILGKSGELSLIMREMKNLSPEEKPKFGQWVNEAKAALEALYVDLEIKLKSKELLEKLSSERLDMTLPGPMRPLGAQHPVEKVMDEVVAICTRLGYSVRTSSLIEKDSYNFEALNIPKDHPARDMQDTFYVDDEHVLRTHTSPIQIHALKSEKPPLKILGPGTVFRCDYDISHLPMFHQVEGMLIDHKVSMAELKGTITAFSREFFGSNVKTRFRPSFFPFTEPSAEFDASCPLCSGKGCRMCGQSGWIEMGGCGLVHPNVLKWCGLDPNEWQGEA
jgi:phenylalanyl-tRNA synthetase alpha chain